jgi:hypothetical protein
MGASISDTAAAIMIVFIDMFLSPATRGRLRRRMASAEPRLRQNAICMEEWMQTADLGIRQMAYFDVSLAGVQRLG